MAIQAEEECLCEQWRTKLAAVSRNIGRLLRDLNDVDRKIAAEKAKNDPDEEVLRELAAQRARILRNLKPLENQQEQIQEQLSGCVGADCDPSGWT
ncbi:hypothetical protein I0C86_40285 [Plantactinospora sp. S1510]|uniref:Uncharacterized protein n=1 Tax=Plantactinospora alkalitolerans TaxID=2789879 RepID=A0ABS0H9X5_9ACTN|nr:hypothetical protein [Plantactinospora alkalitolerans]MBF9135119.1 hypothetical protein [Plantactinospora alkalitolerans]